MADGGDGVFQDGGKTADELRSSSRAQSAGAGEITEGLLHYSSEGLQLLVWTALVLRPGLVIIMQPH